MKLFIIVFMLLNVFWVDVFCQKSNKSVVSEVQKKYILIDTLKTYERVAEKGYKSIDMFKKLGDGYFLSFQKEKAVRWYCELFFMTNKLESKYYFRYAESLKSVGEKEQANKIMDLFHQESKDIKEKI